ncbi:RhoGEF domain-containing protein [Choanephora cucurbitarum]|nr:RhoGEF domain-containing protein [Choanephora cucurbitarum]
MEGNTKDILLDTPFRHPCNIYKESSIPILKDHNVSDQCKEIGRHLLNMTKNPLSQHVDVLIPKLDRSNHAKSQLEHFKSFFGQKHIIQESEKNSTEDAEVQNRIVMSKNAFLFESPITKPIKEFIDTERSYVELLEEIVHKVMKQIKESIVHENKSSILDHYSFNRIFINMEDILEVNKAFLDSLKQYEQGIASESFGEIVLRHINTFDCYRVYLLGKSNSLACHTQNIKQNKNYSKFLLSMDVKGSLGMSDILISPIQRMARYKLLIGVVANALDPKDVEIEYLRQAEDKVSKINDMQYGDSSLLNLYHLIREAPASLIQTRQLLGYFDATELSLLSGKSNRPVTILVFTDKLMVVKRKSYSLQGKDMLDNIEEKVKNTMSTSMLQKAKEAYTGLPFEFKGWVDIKAVEFFHGLKDRSDTFFLRTTLPELDPNATEKEAEEYFRRSDRLYSIIPNTHTKSVNLNQFIENKNKLIALCQKQFALSKTQDASVELYYEDKFKLPAYTHFFDEDSYSAAKQKNHILIVYVEDNKSIRHININKLVDDNVWIIVLLSRHQTSGGYKLVIRAKTGLVPIREISRDMEYECIVDTQSTQRKNNHEPLDFIDTLWNNLFFYERRLRATDAFSCINDGLLRVRSRSRSRSKSLTRVASNMSIGKLFARSRSSSPTRHSAAEVQHDSLLDQAPTSHVLDPVLKIATVNKQVEAEFRAQDKESLSEKHGYRPPKINTQPRHRHSTDFRSGSPSEIFVRNDTHFIDDFNEKKNIPEEMLYSGSNCYQDNSYRHPRPYPSTSATTSTSSRSLGSIHGYFGNTDPSLPLRYSPQGHHRRSPSPEHSISRPSSGGSRHSVTSLSSENTPSDPYPSHTISRRPTEPFGAPYGGSVSSYHSGSSRSYFDDYSKPFDFLPPSPHREKYYGSTRSIGSITYDEKLMSAIDNPRGAMYGSRPPLHPGFYTQPQSPNVLPRQPALAHRPHTAPAVDNCAQLKNDVNQLIDELIQSHNHRRVHDYNNYESMRDMRSHINSKFDELINNINQTQQYQHQHH